MTIGFINYIYNYLVMEKDINIHMASWFCNYNFQTSITIHE
jgi:hypothetical protein